jgi:hypothetical protein
MAVSPRPVLLSASGVGLRSTWCLARAWPSAYAMWVGTGSDKPRCLRMLCSSSAIQHDHETFSETPSDMAANVGPMKSIDGRVHSPDRICTACGRTTPQVKFSLRGRQAPGAYLSMCSDCIYRRYEKPRLDKRAAPFYSYKLERGCADCGYRDRSEALHFEHRPGTVKLFAVGLQVANAAPDRVWAEISKCDVVCANCRMVRQAERRLESAARKADAQLRRNPQPAAIDGGPYSPDRVCTSCARTTPEAHFRPVGPRPATRYSSQCSDCMNRKYAKRYDAARRALLETYKIALGCADCGYIANAAALQFDHLPGNEKLFTVSEEVAWRPMAVVWAEIAKCDVVCARCHAIRTVARHRASREAAYPLTANVDLIAA